MSLKEKISKDLTSAMKSGDVIRRETLRTLRAAFIELDKRGVKREPTEEEELQVIIGATKKRKEAIEQYEKAGRKDLVDQETKELAIINEYLPQQLTLQEVESRIQEIIAQTGASSAKDFGKVMPVAMKELRGKVDGKIIQATVKRFLGE
ncbi:MAG: GatB/YqeY domain-containing protein [Bacteroidota bacterium]